MWLFGILGLFLLTASVTALLARREQQPPNLHWEVASLGEAYAGIVSDLAAFSVTAAVFLADIQTEAKQSLADVMAMFIISFIILMGTTVTYTTFSGASSPEEMIEDFQLGRRVMYILSTLGFYLGMSTGWLGLHPLLIAVNLQEVANVLVWILLAALFGGSSRLGAWLHTLLGVNLLATSLLPYIAFASAAFYKLVLVPRYPELWPTTHTALSLSALVFAVAFPIFAVRYVDDRPSWQSKGLYRAAMGREQNSALLYCLCCHKRFPSLVRRHCATTSERGHTGGNHPERKQAAYRQLPHRVVKSAHQRGAFSTTVNYWLKQGKPITRFATKEEDIMESDHTDKQCKQSRQRKVRTLLGGVASSFIFFVLLTVLTSTPAYATSPNDLGYCGGPLQRACCVTEASPSCDSDLLEIAGCYGDCGGCSSGYCNYGAPTPDQFSHCGGPGQRACCENEVGAANKCDSGATEVTGCFEALGCSCGIGGGPPANSICIKATPCGGEGQRACCGGELVDAVKSCQGSLTEIPGCTGDCTCGGSANPAQISSSGTCASLPLASTAEPGTNATPAASGPSCALTGYADIHVHMFAHLAHGGGVFVGKPYDTTGGITEALKQDYGTNLDLVKKDGGALPSPSCPSFLPNCGSKLFHGDHTLIDDTVGVGTNDTPKSNLGAPIFNGWPAWTSTSHQQVYYKWLERAWQGGLRLMTMLAVTNEALCKSNKHIRNTDCEISMLPPSRLGELDKFDDRFQLKAGETAPTLPLPPIEAQLQAAYQFEDFINAQAGTDESKKWFKIVRTPAEARATISAGKLAVVLGIEVDKLFGCELGGTCTPTHVQTAVDKYYDKGVRHVFPIHNFDNAYGAAATWQDAIAAGQRAAVGQWWGIENCDSAGYGFWLDRVVIGAIYLLGFGGTTEPDYPNGDSQNYASCSANGLFSLAQTLLDALREKGMIIDIDHMSNKSLDNTLTWAEGNVNDLNDDYPVVASHGMFFERYKKEFSGNGGRHERMRTLAQLQKIKKLGGMVAAMLKDDVQDTGRSGEFVDLPYSESNVPNICLHSSRTWAQSYRYAVDVMGGPVAFGSDFNGVAGHVGPRFGANACGGGSAGTLGNIQRLLERQLNQRLSYPFTLPGFGTFDKQVTGKKTFDFNGDGLAHIGLLPDLIADLKAVGMTDAALDPLFKSAEGYVKVWEKANGTSSSGSSATAQCVSQTVNADNTCKATASIATTALLNNNDVTLTQTPAGPYSEGTTSVTLTVTPKDTCDSPTTCTGTVTVEDKTPPSITCPAAVTSECTGSSSATATFAAATVGADNCNGIVTPKGCSPTSGSSFALGDNTVTCSASDDASPTNNVGSCNFTVKVVDTTKPSITAPTSLPNVECTSPNGTSPNLGSPTVSDTCDSTPTVSNNAPTKFPLGLTSVTWTAADHSGNPQTAIQNVTVKDTTPPSISCPAPKTIECTGNRSASFTPVAATASDVCSASVNISNPLTASFPLGATTLNYSVTDAVGLKSTCTSSVTVVDTTKPTITNLSASPSSLRPPNHKMAAVTVSATATDACSSSAPVCQITGISSNEPVNGLEDGDTAPDWQITGPLTASLRAERSGTGTGRIYTVQVTCTDQQGLSTVKSTTVTVPLN